MAIAAKRFDNQSKQTNIAVIDFIDSKSSQILNKTQSGTKKASDALGALAKGEGIANIKSSLEKIDSSGIFGDTRLATDGLSSVMALANESKQTLDKITETVMPVIESVNNTYRSISQEVREVVSIGMAIKQEVETKIELGGQILDVVKNSDIRNIKDLKNLSDKIKSSGAIDQITDTGRLQSLVGAASQKAHDYNMPGYFSDISSVFSNPLDVAKPASDTIEYACTRGDMNAVVDVSKSEGSSFIEAFNPSIDEDIQVSFETPPEVSDSDSSSFFDMFDSAVTQVSDTWDEILGIKSSICSAVNEAGDWTDIVEGKVNNEDVVISEDDDLDKVEEQDYLAGQYSVSNSVTPNSIAGGNTLNDKLSVQSLKVINRPSVFASAVVNYSKEWGVVLDDKSVGGSRVSL